MSYKFLDDEAVADVAFEAEGKSLVELFESSALAVTNTMVKDLKSIENKVEKEIKIQKENVEMLLFNFLQEIIFLKDAEMLLLNKFEIEIDEKNWKINAKAFGEKLDMKKHDLIVDVKAVTLHRFEVKQSKSGWRASVILDI